MKIAVQRSKEHRHLPELSKLGFGKYFADHMFTMNYATGEGWHDPKIIPYGELHLQPSNLALHYGQTIFEGLKAFRWKDGSVHIFRLYDHMDRFVRSAERLGMPLFDPNDIGEAILRLVDIDRGWVPSQRGTALYIRPTLIAADNVLGVRPADYYLMYVITSPVGSYYSKGMAPTRIYVEETYSRVAPGGLGEAKTAANYAASLLAAEEARDRGFDQVLWLDSREHRYIEEVGTMNIFFVVDDTLITPPLGGTILDGITRRSVLQLAQEWGIPVEERPVPIGEIATFHAGGRLKEVFGSGTAATISPVGELNYKGTALEIVEPENSLRKRLYDAITAIQYGESPDPYGWMTAVEESAEEQIPPSFTNGNGEIGAPSIQSQQIEG